MPRLPLQLRILAEVVGIVAVAETTVMFVVPAALPRASETAAALLDAAMLSLLVGPVVGWRVRAWIRASRCSTGDALSEPRPLRTLVMAATLLAAGLTITALGTLGAREAVRRDADQRFAAIAERTVNEVDDRMTVFLHGLRGTRGIFVGSSTVDRAEFGRYAANRSFDSEFVGALGVGYIERVRRDALVPWLARARADGAPDLTVRTAGDASDLLVVKYIEPLAVNRQTLGEDIGADPRSRAAAELAMRTGQATLTAGIEAVEGGQSPTGLLYLLPVYRNGDVPATAEEREASCEGWVYLPIVVRDAMRGALGDADGLADLEIFDGATDGSGALLYDELPDVGTAGVERPGAARPAASRRLHRAVLVGERPWRIVVSATPRFDATARPVEALAVFAVGSVMSLLLAGAFWAIGTAQARAVGLARSMTRELQVAKDDAEAALRETAALHATLDRHSVVSIADRDGRILEVNDAFCRISGYAREELLGQDHRIVASGEHPPTFWAEMWESLRAGRAWRGEVCNRRKDGSLFWVDTIIAPLRATEGRGERFVSIRFDITQAKLAEARLRQSEQRFERAVNGTGEGLWEYDMASGALWVSDRYLAMLGIADRADFPPVGSSWLDRLHPDDRPDVLERFALHRGEGRAEYDVQYRLRCASGEYRWFRSRAASVRDSAGRVAKTSGSITDIHEQRCAEQRLAENEARLRAILEGTDVVAWEYDPTGGAFTYVSPKAMELGYPMEAWLRPGFWEATLHPDDRDRVIEECRRETLAGRNHRMAYRMSKASGETIWVEDVVSVDVGPGGALRLRGVLIDVSEQRRLRELAESANQSKTEFLANMSHEIRTPMTAILGFADLLAEDGDRAAAPPRRFEYIDTIRRNGEHLLTLINDILDISKIEAGKLVVEAIETRPVDLVHDVMSLMRVKAVSKGVALDAGFDTPVPQAIRSDPLRLRQILVNLVGNAIKFTESGGVSLRVAFDGPTMRFAVIDTGIGLLPEQREKLFGAFVQADASTTRRFGGTGLGLRISKRLAEMLGGDIAVRSMPGQGSTFELTVATGLVAGAAVPMVEPGQARIPRAETPVPAASTAAGVDAAGTRPLEGVRILLAEDGADNQRLLSFLLGKAGASVEVVEHGRLAVEALSEGGDVDAPLRPDAPFDLLLTDMQMPEMDGYTATRLLRAKGCRLPVIALTANAMSHDAERCRSAGCDDYLSKPVDRVKLIEACMAAVARDAADRTAAVGGPVVDHASRLDAA